MKTRIATLLLLAAITGCEKKDQGSQTANPGPGNPAVQPGPMVNDTGTPKTDTGMMQNNMPPAGNTATTAPSAMDQVKSMSANASDSMKDVGSSMSDQAQKYYDQISQSIKDKKFDVADSSMAKLTALKGKLPVEWQTKIDSLQQSLTNAKNG